MTETDIVIERWAGSSPPSEAELRRIYADEGMQPYRWSNAPGDVYSAHTHSYHKVLYCVEGSITFRLPARDAEVQLQAGDRLELPPGVSHAADVGPQGVVCLEAHRRTGP